jgi:hypothetical protein
LQAMALKILKTPFQAPQANAFCERLIGTVRREWSHTTIGTGHMRVSGQASPTYGLASSGPNCADTTFRLINKL